MEKAKTVLIVAVLTGIWGIVCPRAAAFDDWASGLESSGIERSSAPSPAVADAGAAGTPTDASAGPAADALASVRTDMSFERAQADLLRSPVMTMPQAPIASAGFSSMSAEPVSMTGQIVARDGQRVTITRLGGLENWSPGGGSGGGS